MDERLSTDYRTTLTESKDRIAVFIHAACEREQCHIPVFLKKINTLFFLMCSETTTFSWMFSYSTFSNWCPVTKKKKKIHFLNTHKKNVRGGFLHLGSQLATRSTHNPHADPVIEHIKPLISSSRFLWTTWLGHRQRFVWPELSPHGCVMENWIKGTDIVPEPQSSNHRDTDYFMAVQNLAMVCMRDECVCVWETETGAVHSRMLAE